MAVCQNLVPLVNIKIAGKWMFIPLKMVLIGIDPYPYYPNQYPNQALPEVAACWCLVKPNPLDSARRLAPWPNVARSTA